MRSAGWISPARGRGLDHIHILGAARHARPTLREDRQMHVAKPGKGVDRVGALGALVVAAQVDIERQVVLITQAGAIMLRGRKERVRAQQRPRADVPPVRGRQATEIARVAQSLKNDLAVVDVRACSPGRLAHAVCPLISSCSGITLPEPATRACQRSVISTAPSARDAPPYTDGTPRHFISSSSWDSSYSAHASWSLTNRPTFSANS